MSKLGPMHLCEVKVLPANQLIEGDLIWVDMVAFGGDGSIYKEKKNVRT